jgi:hypothetical protein
VSSTWPWGCVAPVRESPCWTGGTREVTGRAPDPHADLLDFRRQNMDLYIAPSDAGYWEGAIRADDDPLRPGLLSALAESRPFTIELLYGDQDGGQRTISRFHVLPTDDKGWYCQATLHRNIDRPDPRWRTAGSLPRPGGLR